MKEIIHKLNIFISDNQKYKLIMLLILLSFGVILEIFGLGILVPVITIILEPDFVEQNPLIRKTYDFFEFNSYRNFTYSFLFSVTILYVLKTFYIIYLSHRQNRFVANLIARVSNMLFSKYMYAPYSYHLVNNSSRLIKNIQIEVHSFWNLCISVMTIFIETSLLVSIIITIIYIEPIGAISIGIFFSLLSIAFYQFTKKKIKIWGEKREVIDNKNSKILLEGFGGIKDIIVMGKQGVFTTNFTNNNFIKARLWSNNAIFSQLPRFFLELVSLIGLIGFVLIMLFQEKEINTLITILGVFVAATFRLIPSLNRIINASQTLKFNMPSLNILYDEIRGTKSNYEELNKRKLKLEKEIKIHNISFFYQGEKENVLDKLNFKIKKGEIIGFIGKSGSGKSTLVDLLIGLHKPTSGEIYIDKRNLTNNLRQWQNNIGYVPQNIFLVDNTIESNIAFGLPEDEIDSEQISKVLELSQLQDFIRSLKHGVKTRVGERGVQISGGQRQRLGIARALYHNPEILILDEATSALDMYTEAEVMKSVYKLKGNKTILIIAHRMSSLEGVDRIIKIQSGKIFEQNKLYSEN